MAQLHCEVITAERIVFDDDVDVVVAPGIEGQLAILPHHAPLLTSLTFGELILRREGQEDEVHCHRWGHDGSWTPTRHHPGRFGRAGRGDRHCPCRGSEATR